MRDDILDAVIRQRLANTHGMLAQWEAESESPTDRIRSFVNILAVNMLKIKRYGCPVGTLCHEMVKLDHPAKENANEIFTLFRVWLSRQFEQLGRKIDADELAMHVLALSQGVAMVASAFGDEKFIRCEVQRINEWLSPYVIP